MKIDTGDYYNDNIEINKDENSDDGDKMRTMIMTMAIMIKWAQGKVIEKLKHWKLNFSSSWYSDKSDQSADDETQWRW